MNETGIVAGGAGMSIRDAFAERFGADQAEALWAAALKHENRANGKNKGSDPFRWALLICIGYQCFEVDRFRKYHGITAPRDEIVAWIKDHADLGSHVGDCDYLALRAGTYNEFMPDKVTAP